MSMVVDHPVGALGASRPRALEGWPDRLVALLLLPVILTVLVVFIPIMLIVQGRPILYVSERMKAPGEAFRLLKLRTMEPGPSETEGVLGGSERRRVTPLGRLLRATRIDEFPQIVNVLRGDIRFIGPRPPLRRYVEAYPDLYRAVLVRRPGITGLATVRLHAREARLLSACASPEETDSTYRRACLPAKARLDLFYHRKRSIALDALILVWTFSRLLPNR